MSKLSPEARERLAAARRIQAAIRNDASIADDRAVAVEYFRRGIWPWWKVAIGPVCSVVFWPQIQFAFTADVLSQRVFISGLIGFVLVWSQVLMTWQQVRRRRWLARHPLDPATPGA